MSETDVRVIGSGFGRTGTTSMKAALEQLGFGRCYHMQEVFKRPSHARAWGRWRPGSPPDIDRLFAGFGATVDFPASLMYVQLLHRFPEAKVVHTVRDPDRWYDSTAETIYRARDVFRSVPLRFVPPVRDLYEMLDAVIWDGLFHGRFGTDRSPGSTTRPSSRGVSPRSVWPPGRCPLPPRPG